METLFMIQNFQNDSDPSARLEFNVGKNANDVWIKNVSVQVK